MQPGKMDLAIYRGDSYKWQFILWLDDAKTVPADLTGATVKAEMRVGPGTAVLTTFVTTITMPNKINVSITSAVSGALPSTGGKWDLQVTQAGEVTTIVAGLVTITPDITDSTVGMMLMAEGQSVATVRRVI